MANTTRSPSSERPLVGEPELRSRPTGRSQLTIGLAVTPDTPDRNRPGEWIEDTSFFKRVCWTYLRRERRASSRGLASIIVMAVEPARLETDNTRSAPASR